jgi:O-antigen ligase
MTSHSLADAAPVAVIDRDVARRSGVLTLEPAQRTVLVTVIAAAAVAVAAPYPVTKVILGATLALYWAKLFFQLDERFVGMFVLLLPTLQLAPLEALGVPALNWQTIFLIVFVAASAMAAAPPVRLAAPGWITYFSILVALSALYAWMTVQPPLWPLLVIVKNWLFPFSLFFLGRRLVTRPTQLWFLLLCVAVVSFALALHGLRDGLTAGHLLTNRPAGLLTGQANLFAGFLAMQALLCLFVARTRDLGWIERGFLVGAAFVMVVTLVFTLSRGAWLAFGLAGLLVGFVTNRVAVVLLVIAVVVGSRWAPDEAAARADLTITAVGQSGDSTLEDALDDSAALRVIQWKAFPDLLMDSPLWGTGIGTFAQRLGQHTGIFRSAHATMVQIGTEMGVLGLLGYIGLFASVATACVSRARRAAPGGLLKAAGLGLLAATVCLFLLDFSGTRFPAHTVTTYYWLLVGAYLGSTDYPPQAAGFDDPAPDDRTRDHDAEPHWAAA